MVRAFTSLYRIALDKVLNNAYLLFFIVASGLLINFILLPTFNIIKVGFLSDNIFSVIEKIQLIFSRSYNITAIQFSIKQAFLSAFITLSFSIPLAFLISKYRLPFKRFVIGVVCIPFAMPTILIVLGLVIVFGDNGYINSLLQLINKDYHIPFIYNIQSIIAAHVIYNISITLLLILTGLKQIEEEILESSYIVGASKMRTFVFIELPIIKTVILKGFLVVFLYSFTSLVIPLTLGGGPQYTTLEGVIYFYIKSIGDYQAASILSIFQLFITVPIFALYLISSKNRGDLNINDTDYSYIKPPTMRALVLWLLYLVLVFLFVVMPLLSIVLGIFLYGNDTLSFIENIVENIRLFSSDYYTGMRRSVFNSLTYGVIVGLITTSLAIFTAGYTVRISKSDKMIRFMELVFIIPMLTSSVMLALGFSLVYSAYNSWVFLILIQSLLAFPISYIIIKSEWWLLNKEIVEASFLDGANQLQALIFIEAPAIKRSILITFFFSFAISLGEFNAAAILTQPNSTTIPVQIYYLINKYQLGPACVLGTATMMILIIVYAVIYSQYREKKQ